MAARLITLFVATITATACASGHGSISSPSNVAGSDWQRVIVELRTAAANTDEQRRAAIATAREGLLRELPRDRYRVLRSYDTIPFVALQASPEALTLIKRSMWVAGVQDDATASPQ